MYLGLVALNASLPLSQLVKNPSTGAPSNADAAPTYRVYGPSGLMTGGTGSLSLEDTGSIQGASNASPIQITSANHGLTTGTLVTITGVAGNTNANGTWTITVTGPSTFTLNSSTGNAPYTSGGTWNVAGLYTGSVSPLESNGYVSGQTYTVLVSAAVSAAPIGDLHTFTVV